MSIVVTVRIPATLEQALHAEQAEPGLYDRVIALARSHGLISHRRVFRDGEILDIDEWPSEAARAAFREEALPLLERLGAARGLGRPTSETWLPYPG